MNGSEHGEGRKNRRRTEVVSVARACDILQAWRRPGETLELREIASRAGLHKATAYRLLQTLTAKGLLERSGAHGYGSRFQPVSTTRLRIGYAAQSTVVPFIAAVTDSLRVASREAGFELVELNNKASRKVALRNADRLIREKVNLVIEFQLFADLASIIAAKYSLAQIPVIAVGVPHPGAVYFGPDNYKAGMIGGRCLADWVRQHWRGTLDEIVLLGVATAGPTHEARLNGIVDGLVEASPQCRGAAMYRYDVNGRFEQAQEAIRKHLTNRRARRIAVGAVNDMSALGALEAFRECGAEDRCAVVGQDGVPEARAELRRPNSRLVGTVAYFPETYGTQLICIAKELLEHRTVPPAIVTQHRLLTAATVHKLYPNDRLLGDSCYSAITFTHRI